MAQADVDVAILGGGIAGLWLLAARGYLLKGDQLPPGDENMPLHYTDAAAQASRAIQFDPKLVEAYAVLARANRMLNKTPDALEAV